MHEVLVAHIAFWIVIYAIPSACAGLDNGTVIHLIMGKVEIKLTCFPKE